MEFSLSMNPESLQKDLINPMACPLYIEGFDGRQFGGPSKVMDTDSFALLVVFVACAFVEEVLTMFVVVAFGFVEETSTFFVEDDVFVDDRLGEVWLVFVVVTALLVAPWTDFVVPWNNCEECVLVRVAWLVVGFGALDIVLRNLLSIAS